MKQSDVIDLLAWLDQVSIDAEKIAEAPAFEGDAHKKPLIYFGIRAGQAARAIRHFQEVAEIMEWIGSIGEGGATYHAQCAVANAAYKGAKIKKGSATERVLMAVLTSAFTEVYNMGVREGRKPKKDVFPFVPFGTKTRIRGMRITVEDVRDYLAGGMSAMEILADFPELTLEEIETIQREDLHVSRETL